MSVLTNMHNSILLVFYLSSGHGGAELARGNHSGTALLHGGHKLGLDPGLVQVDGLTLGGGVGNVRVLGGAVVAPDRHPPHVLHRHTQLETVVSLQKGHF